MAVLDQVGHGLPDPGAVVGEHPGTVDAGQVVTDQHHRLTGGLRPQRVLRVDRAGQQDQSVQVLPGNRTAEIRHTAFIGALRSRVQGLHGNDHGPGRGGSLVHPGDQAP